jgi:predicted regulator of Ras-like GTPase activity (Roadblock/LC7/MglB family)/FixJ family two-component response regulator
MIESNTLVLPRVLVIDYSRTVREAIRKRIANQFDVREESDGESGWQTLLVDPSIQAVIADVALPKLDGYALLQRVRASHIPRINGLRVIMMSGDANPAARALAKSLGATDFISKGTGHTDLTTCLGTLFDSSRVPRELTETSMILARKARSEPKNERTTAQVVPLRIPNPEQESQMSRFDSLTRVLKNLQSESPGVEASALISEDGLMIASALSQDFDETRVAGMTATLLSLGTRAATELRRGEVKEVIVRGEQGYAVMIHAGRGAVLLVLASETTPLGLIFFDMREAIKNIKNIL